MTSKILVVGSKGGIGSACTKELLAKGHDVKGLSSNELDLNFPEKIFDLNLSGFDILMNCSGHSQGTYLGFLQNPWYNQFSQIMVNYASNLALLKHYATSRSSGKYVWISTSLLLDKVRPYHSIYASTKQASKTAIDLIRQEATHIDILEVNVGPTKTGFRYRNFQGTKTHEEINNLYQQENGLSAEYVAGQIIVAIENNTKELIIQ